MSPRTTHSSLASRLPSGSKYSGQRRSRHHSPEYTNMAMNSSTNMTNTSFIMSASMDTSDTGNQIWDTDIVSHQYADANVADFDSMVLGDYSAANNFVLPMAPVNDCFDAASPVYPILNHAGMSQTLTGPYQESVLENDLMSSSSVNTNYYHYPQTTIRHGLPSPPADAEYFHEYQDELSMDPMCDVNFSTLPGPAVEMSTTYEKMQGTSDSRQVQPRPIRSASERSTTTDHSTLALDDSHYSRDERADKVKARSDPRYDCKPDAAGYYHCPMATEEPCNHKPTKQKCIYAKYLDSHLKPYICKHGGPGNDCENLRFSSNACLFRHEREAHGMHNHGINPYLCLYPGCERARLDNGFPRRWNQRDHMKRVHDWNDADADDASGDKYGPAEPTRRKKSGSTQGVQMRRSSSSQAKAQAASSARASRTTATPRYQAQFERQVQDYNVVEYLMPVNDASFTQYPQQHRISPGYANSYSHMS